MSSIDFAPIRREHPELDKAALEVDRWLAKHDRLKRLSVSTLGRALGDEIQLLDIGRLLHELARQGQLEVTYAALDSDGQMSDEEFESPDDIPEVGFDCLNKPFMIDRSRIIPVYRVRSRLSHGNR